VVVSPLVFTFLLCCLLQMQGRRMRHTVAWTLAYVVLGLEATWYIGFPDESRSNASDVGQNNITVQRNVAYVWNENIYDWTFRNEFWFISY
jgi:hypothetical protein